MRRHLVDAVGALSPPGGGQKKAAEHPNESAGEIVRLRYLEGLPPPAVQRRLAISRSYYFRLHQRGLDAVASVLRQKWAVPAA